jgi:hypothetical protein
LVAVNSCGCWVSGLLVNLKGVSISLLCVICCVNLNGSMSWDPRMTAPSLSGGYF